MKACAVRNLLLIAGIASASLLVTLAVAVILVLTDRPTARQPVGDGLDLARVPFSKTSGSLVPEAMAMRDGVVMPTRIYGMRDYARRVIILIHGSGWHGQYFHQMASALAQLVETAVLVPDLRGHGATPVRRGDVDFIGQLEDDLADLIANARRSHPNAEIVLGGHSSPKYQLCTTQLCLGSVRCRRVTAAARRRAG